MKKLLFLLVLAFGIYQNWHRVETLLFSPPEIVSSYDSERWLWDAKGYKQALRESGETGAPILIYFYADWCKFCQKLEESVMTQPEFVDTTRSIIKVRINPERNEDNRLLAQQFHAGGYPLVFVQYTPDQAKENNIRLDWRGDHYVIQEAPRRGWSGTDTLSGTSLMQIIRAKAVQ